MKEMNFRLKGNFQGQTKGFRGNMQINVKQLHDIELKKISYLGVQRLPLILQNVSDLAVSAVSLE